ncbi:glycosyltransferase family 9 protein [Nocardia sp. NBC_00508]|uniref:glycosyltransferase family 9 protein n=1 Tax=Nocardia sp. NBC_00508 TaxID=2975992 RepID=UPI002E82065F|nr:glycosyltransferase family 9 protein [Nocardia sp. NBC_00508]WUD66411.1 glycosyltransferase family 9 protein [Nocardia sp. NBC_00508]
MTVTLVLCAHGLRELLTAVPALRALHDAKRRHRLVLATPGWLRPIVELADCVDELHATPMGDVLRWNAPPPAFAVDLHGTGADSISALLATGPEYIIAHRHKEFPQVCGPAWQPDLPETARWCRLLEWVGIPADPARLDLAPPPESTGERESIVVHPGGAPARRWPAERFAAVAADLREWGRPVRVVGSAADRPLACRVAEQAGLPETSVLAGELTLRELAVLVADAALVLSGDTGVGHLATAFGTPSVQIFGPESPAIAGPPSEREAHIVLWAGRVDDPLADAPAPGLTMISIAEVVAAADRQLTSRVQV